MRQNRGPRIHSPRLAENVLFSKLILKGSETFSYLSIRALARRAIFFLLLSGLLIEGQFALKKYRPFLAARIFGLSLVSLNPIIWKRVNFKTGGADENKKSRTK